MTLSRGGMCACRCLNALAGLKGSAYLHTTRRITRLRLQSELYALTSRAGPRFISRAVNKAAFQVLDGLFPLGRGSRRLVSWVFWAIQLPLQLVAAVSSVARSTAAFVWVWGALVWSLMTGRFFCPLVDAENAPRGRRRVST